jgi:hypothetical protein
MGVSPVLGCRAPRFLACGGVFAGSAGVSPISQNEPYSCWFRRGDATALQSLQSGGEFQRIGIFGPRKSGPGNWWWTRRSAPLNPGVATGDRLWKKPLSEKLVELNRFLHNKLEDNHPLHGLQASPQPPQPVEVFILGATASSAELAADFGMPYIFVLFLNNDEIEMRQAVKTYRTRFDTTKGAQPQAMLALHVIVTDTEDEAAHYASEITLVKIKVESGRTLTVFSVEAAKEFARQSQEKCTFSVQDGKVIHGSRETAGKKLQDIQRLYQVDELFIVTPINDFRKRLHSYKLLSEVFTQGRVS